MQTAERLNATRNEGASTPRLPSHARHALLDQLEPVRLTLVASLEARMANETRSGQMSLADCFVSLTDAVSVLEEIYDQCRLAAP